MNSWAAHNSLYEYVWGDVIIHTFIDATCLKHHVQILISNYYKAIYKTIDINMHD